jgi:metal-responsive CopG/Arc/MetJ family transcriptional regulator
MGKISLRVPDPLLGELDTESDEIGVSRSEYIRNTLASRNDSEELRRENDRLRNEKRALIQQREEHTALVEYVEDEREIQERREQRQQRNVLRRAWWWLVGAPAE